MGRFGFGTGFRGWTQVTSIAFAATVPMYIVSSTGTTAAFAPLPGHNGLRPVTQLHSPHPRSHGTTVSRANTRATIRSQRSPANSKTSRSARLTLCSSASRSRLLARKCRLRTVSAGTPRHCAVSATVRSSTERRTNTARRLSGSASILLSSNFRICARPVNSSGDPESSDAIRSSASARGEEVMGITLCLQSRRRSLPSVY